ncbi:hypothetical protein [Halobacteriovorax sp. JY17]|uniref:hypothetical protein n=1 Tax=Halobacteriovorax sp. JY17 TaxID=2014617 RepID=UPI000C37E3F7|nr:hypothetical protein [Halobacteriovorax sp. JY17]PIK15778.1 MAG: hypothetical protein CES88_03355 [Halobacteriovorax sp. JY17]
MKQLILLATLLTFSNSYAENFLTESQADTVLESIDNICGDTWCEGDFNFSFNEITCSSETNSCDLSFEFINEVYDYETDQVIVEERASVTCTLTGVTGYEYMIDTSSRWNHLGHSFYEKVTDCISDKEEIAYDTFTMDY